jgi:hypothetical protein
MSVKRETYAAEQTKSASAAKISADDFVRKLMDFLTSESITGRESRSLYKGLEFELPIPEIVQEFACYVLDKFADNEYLSVLCPMWKSDRLLHIAKGRFCREPRKVDPNTGDLLRNGREFQTYLLPGTFFVLWRKFGTGKEFGETLLAMSNLLTANNLHIKVTDVADVLTTDYKNGTEKISLYQWDLVDANSVVLTDAQVNALA